jgi:hypothetical protein
MLQLDKPLVEALHDARTLKALATSDASGSPHVVERRSIHLDADGNLVELEQLQSSPANPNLIRSLWFDRTVAVSVSDHAGRSWQITGKPIKVYVTGPLFRRFYDQVRRESGDVDLAAVWIIQPLAMIEETPGVRQAEDEPQHPYHRHLDRLAVDRSSEPA